MTNTILEPHLRGHPITYNHYFTDNVQQMKIQNRKKRLSKILDNFLGTDMSQGRTFYNGAGFSVPGLLNALTEGTTADMDRYACSEAIDCMRAYYKVRRNRPVLRTGA